MPWIGQAALSRPRAAPSNNHHPMTLVVAAISKKSIWLLTDRRVSCGARTLTDNARKLLFLETTDGVALLGYAGLRSTAFQTEPGDWMARVLRGRNLPLEQSLSALADAVRAKIPGHLRPLPAHFIFVPAFLGGDPRLYSIDIVRPPGRTDYFFRYARHVTSWPSAGWASTKAYRNCWLRRSSPIARSEVVRELLKIVAAHDAGRITPQAVASHLARLNYQVSTRVDRVCRPALHCCLAISKGWRFGAHTAEC